MNKFQDESDTLEGDLQEAFPPIVTKRYHKTSGKPLMDHVLNFNPGSRKQIAERLMEKGWIPKLKTEKGSVAVSDEILDGNVKNGQIPPKWDGKAGKRIAKIIGRFLS